MFAAFYCVMNFCKVTNSAHSFCRVTAIYIFFTYYITQMVLTLVLVGSFYATFNILLDSFAPSDGEVKLYSWTSLADGLYVLAHFFLIIVSTTVNLGDAGLFFKFFVNVFGVYLMAMLILAALHLTKTLSLAATFALIFGVGFGISYVLPILINFRRVSVFKYVFGAITLLYLTPTYIIIMVIYAICNIHDISWGNRPDTAEAKQETAKQRRTEEVFKAYRTKALLLWIILNVMISMLVIDLSSSNNGQESMFIIIFAIFSAFVIWLRLCLALINTCIACAQISHIQSRTDKMKKTALELETQEEQRLEETKGVENDERNTAGEGRSRCKVAPDEEDKYSAYSVKDKNREDAKTAYSEKHGTSRRVGQSYFNSGNYNMLPSLGETERQVTARSFIASPRDNKQDEKWKIDPEESFSDSQDNSLKMTNRQAQKKRGGPPSRQPQEPALGPKEQDSVSSVSLEMMEKNQERQGVIELPSRISISASSGDEV